jgi:prophage DNA circulation protein
MREATNPTELAKYIPSASEVVERMKANASTVGSLSFVEEFLSVLPESAKIPENEEKIVKLFGAVSDTMRSIKREIADNYAPQESYIQAS